MTDEPTMKKKKLSTNIVFFRSDDKYGKNADGTGRDGTGRLTNWSS